mgnify:CR=1 FL=1
MGEKQNNYAFIDSQNLNLSIREMKWILDFAKFRILLKNKYQVDKAFLFIGYVPGNETLYTYLQSAGYIVIFKPTIYDKDLKVTKGNVDAELVLHCMIEYANFDKTIIVSGDGDFHCLIKYFSENGKLLRIGIPSRRKFSSLLRSFRPYFFFVDDLKHKLEYKKRQRVDQD